MLLSFEDEFREKYETVFDSDGNVKACGRQACKELIELCEKIRPVPQNAYGDADTGVMNISAIKALAFDTLQY